MMRPTGGLLRSTRLRIGLGLVTLVVIAVAAYGGWYLFLRPAGPPPVNLAAVPAASQAPTAASSAPAAASSAPGPGISGASSYGSTPQGPRPAVSRSKPVAAPALAPVSGTGPAVTAASLDGTWKVNSSIGSGATGSFVGYRVQEQLAGIGANTAVGRTSNVTGSFTLQGTTITAASFSADLTTLTSDDPMRDGQLARRGLETATYPTATFVLDKPIDLGSIPAQGRIVSVAASGQLTLHGQSRTVQITLQARISGGVIAIAGSLPIVFSDYGIIPPTSFIALSVADHGTMEVQLMFTHA